MNKLSLLLQEEDASINLTELGTEVLRELFMAARKITVYDPSHPQARRAVERPLLLFRKYFQIRSVADIRCDSNTLYFAGIEMARGPFTDGLARDLSALRLRHVFFLPGLAEQDLLGFLGRLTRKVPLENVDDYMWNHLNSLNITSIKVNDEKWEERLKDQRTFRLQDAGELSVKRLVVAECGDNTELVAAVAAGNVPTVESLAERYNCFFTPVILTAVLPDRFASLSRTELLNLVSSRLHEADTDLPSLIASSSQLEQVKNLLAAFGRHPERRELMEAVREMFHRQGIAPEAHAVLDSQSRLQLEVMREVDEYTARIFSTACTPDDLHAYGAAFARLLRSGHSKKPEDVLAALLLHLKRDDRDARRKAQFLLGRAIAAAAATQSWTLLEWCARAMGKAIEAGEETFEFSELLGALGEHLVGAGRFAALADLGITVRRSFELSTIPTEHLVAESALQRWAEPRLVSVMMSALVDQYHGVHPHLPAALQAIGGHEVARQAAASITHPERRVRMTMLKLLAGLGADARDVSLALITPEDIWKRPGAATRLPDDQWYTVRNALHILGRVGDPGALPLLKLHLGDPDRRVRLEIARTLERIGNDDALRFLILLAQDKVPDIRQAAIVALGAAGGEHEAFVLEELFATDHDNADKLLYAIGHIGGARAREFLFAMLDSDQPFKDAGYPRNRIAPLRETVLKALAQHPDSETIQRIEEFCKAHNRTFRFPLAADKLSDTAKVALDKAKLRVRRS